jgi:hypothetical protein
MTNPNTAVASFRNANAYVACDAGYRLSVYPKKRRQLGAKIRTSGLGLTVGELNIFYEIASIIQTDRRL